MPEHHLPRFDPGALLDVARQDGADRALIEAHVPEGVAVHGGLRFEAVDDRRLRDDHEDVGIADRAMALHRPHDLLARDLDLRNDDEIGTAREPTVRSDPAGIATHRLYDDDAVMRARRGAQPIQRVGDDRHRRVEADAVVGLGEVVVDGLRDADHADALLVKPLRDAKGVVATDRHESVDAPAPNAVEHRAARGLVLAGIGARGAQDRPALAKDPVRVPNPEWSWLGLSEQAGPAVRDTEQLVTQRGRAQDDRADRRVQPGGVAAAGEDPDAQG